MQNNTMNHSPLKNYSAAFINAVVFRHHLSSFAFNKKRSHVEVVRKTSKFFDEGTSRNWEVYQTFTKKEIAEFKKELSPWLEAGLGQFHAIFALSNRMKIQEVAEGEIVKAISAGQFFGSGGGSMTVFSNAEPIGKEKYNDGCLSGTERTYSLKKGEYVVYFSQDSINGGRVFERTVYLCRK